VTSREEPVRRKKQGLIFVSYFNGHHNLTPTEISG